MRLQGYGLQATVRYSQKRERPAMPAFFFDAFRGAL
jgi:hypothetical protein